MLVDNRIAGALFGKTQRGVLGLLFTHAERDFHLGEVVRYAGTGVGAVQRELARLVDAGLVTRRKRANLVLYQANVRSPAFPHLRDLMVVTCGVGDVLRDALVPLAARIRVAFLFGSVARAEERNASDIDLFVVGDVSFGDVVSVLHPTQLPLGREVNPVVYGADAFGDAVVESNSFIATVLEEPKVFLIGDADELGRLAAQRLADAT